MTERKLIAGVPHKKVPCSLCGELIWVNDRRASGMIDRIAKKNETCIDCSGRKPLIGTGRGDDENDRNSE